MATAAQLGPKARARFAKAARTLDLALCGEDPWTAIVQAVDHAVPRAGAMVYTWESPSRLGRVVHSLGGEGWGPLHGAKEGIERLGVSRWDTDPSPGRPLTLVEAFRGDVRRANSFREESLRANALTDQLRLTFYRRSRLLAWVGQLCGGSDRGFQAEDVETMRALGPHIRAVLEADDALRTGERTLARSSVGQILDALPDAALLIDGRGRVLFANQRARLSISTLAGVVARPDAIPRAFASVTQIDLEGRSAWLVLPRRQEGGPDASELPPALREIALLCARGLTDKEIAAATGRPLATVRTYVERALRAVGAHTRAELSMSVWKGGRT